MSLLTLNKLCTLIGRDRRSVVPVLESAGIMPRPGPNRSQLYESTDAIPAIFANGASADSLEAARIRLANEQASLAQTRNECLRKERIDMEIPAQDNDKLTQSVAATLKACIGKVLTEERVQEIFAKFRDFSAKLR